MSSIPAAKVGEIAEPKDIANFASRRAFCSHLVTEFCPAVFDAIDGGLPLVTKINMWNPIRGPVVFSSEVLPLALARLEAAVRDPSTIRAGYADWTIEELSRAIELYRHAIERGEAVVSILG